MGVFRVLGGSCSAFFRPNPPAHSPTRAQAGARRAASGEGSSPSEASLRGVGQLRNLGGCHKRQVHWEEAAAGAVKGPSLYEFLTFIHTSSNGPQRARAAHTDTTAASLVLPPPQDPVTLHTTAQYRTVHFGLVRHTRHAHTRHLSIRPRCHHPRRCGGSQWWCACVSTQRVPKTARRHTHAYKTKRVVPPFTPPVSPLCR